MGTLASELRPIARDMSNRPRVYVDANIPAGAVSVMRHDLRWDVLFVIEHENLRRASDAAHFSHATNLGRLLITLDRDFVDDRRFPAALGAGVIVCAVTDERTLLKALRYIDRELLADPAMRDGCLVGRKIVLTADMVCAA